jgi:hypothetical protein
MDDLLRDAAERAIRYRRDVTTRPVWPRAAAVDALDRPEFVFINQVWRRSHG